MRLHGLGRRGYARFGVASAAVLVAWLSAGSASGATWDAGKRAPSSVLAGDGVTWLTRSPRGGLALYSARPGRQPVKVDSFRRPAEPAEFNGGVLAGSGSAIALETDAVIPATHGDSTHDGGTAFYVGAFGRRLEPLDRCYLGEGTGLGRIDVSGSTVAFTRCDEKLEVRDLKGSAPPQVLGHDVHAIRLAGRYVAWLEGAYLFSARHNEADLVVYDLKAGTEAYRIPAGAIPTPLRNLSLQRDGKVAFVFDPSGDDTDPRVVVAWASREHPTVHTLPLPARLSYTATLADNRIVFARYRSSSGGGTREQLGVTDLKGHSHLIVKKGSGLGIDFDGKHIAYTIHACHRYTVVRQLLSARKPAAPACR
jgi:hypothetical protein